MRSDQKRNRNRNIGATWVHESLLISVINTVKDRPFILTSRHGLKLDITVRKRFGQM